MEDSVHLSLLHFLFSYYTEGTELIYEPYYNDNSHFLQLFLYLQDSLSYRGPIPQALTFQQKVSGLLHYNHIMDGMDIRELQNDQPLYSDY